VATDEVAAQSGRAVGHMVAPGARTRIGDHAVVHSVDVKARSTADLVVHLKDAVPSKRATAHFTHAFAQLEMHGVVVPLQALVLGELLVALGALKDLARLAFVNASFVVAQRLVAAEPSQTLLAVVRLHDSTYTSCAALTS
jgi:hypothetical protein